MSRVTDELAQREFADWLALPKEKRVPKTIKAWAEAHGYPRETVSRWQDSPEVKKRAAKVASGFTQADDIAAVAFRLRAQALKGDVASARMLFEMAGVFIELADDDREAIQDAVLSKAKSGNVPAAKFVISRAQKPTEDVDEEDVRGMSDEELRALAEGHPGTS